MRSNALKAFFILLIAGIVQLPGTHPSAGAENREEIKVSPQRIEIGSFYHGTSLTCSGTVPEASKVALMVLGEKKEHFLKRKGKVGPFWMNVDTVTIENVPEVYYLFTSSDSKDELASPEFLAAKMIGYEALEKAIAIEQRDSDSGSTFHEFIKLKERAGLFRISRGSITIKPADGGFATFTVSVAIPPLVPTGKYEVLMYCFGEDRSVSSVSDTFTVEKVGLPKELSALAFNHAALYGILSIVIAMAAGLLTGLLFGSKAKGGH